MTYFQAPITDLFCAPLDTIPVYLYYAHLLGIRPLEPGFKKFAFDPAACAVDRHEGQIATPSGVIKIKLQRIEDHLVGELEHPRQLVPVFSATAIGNEVRIAIIGS